MIGGESDLWNWEIVTEKEYLSSRLKEATDESNPLWDLHPVEKRLRKQINLSLVLLVQEEWGKCKEQSCIHSVSSSMIKLLSWHLV